MNWFIALVMIFAAYAGSAGSIAAYGLDAGAVSADTGANVPERKDAAPILRASAVIARHSCPGSSGKLGLPAISSCLSDIGYIVSRSAEVFGPTTQAHTLHAGNFRSGASYRPLFRPPILTV